MLLKNKLEKIQKHFEKNSVLTSLEERYCYSQDASNLAINTKIPDLVVFVETIEDVQNVVKFANIHEVPIVARGAGTNMVGSCATTQGGIVLNFSKMNKILDINSTNMTVTVQPGVVLETLKNEVDKLNLFYPPDPSNFKVSTVGGSIAQSSGGASSFKYGTTKDYILSLKMVMADGVLITVGTNTVKNSVGYHLAQLIVGSEGTLGLVVEATLKLLPKPKTRAVISSYFQSTEDCVRSVTALINSSLFPTSIDYMDKNSIETVENFSKLGLNVEADNLLIVEFDGYEETLDYQTRKTHEIFQNQNAFGIDVLTSSEDCEKVWQARRTSFAAATALAPDIVSDDIIVPRDALAEMISFCKQVAQKYNLKMCLVGHIGDGGLHPQIALDLNNENEFKNLMSAKSEMYGKALQLGGTISGEHGVGLEKISYIEKVVSAETLEYMKFIKKSFDPKNILNPGKIFNL